MLIFLQHKLIKYLKYYIKICHFIEPKRGQKVYSYGPWRPSCARVLESLDKTFPLKISRTRSFALIGDVSLLPGFRCRDLNCPRVAVNGERTSNWVSSMKRILMVTKSAPSASSSTSKNVIMTLIPRKCLHLLKTLHRVMSFQSKLCKIALVHVIGFMQAVWPDWTILESSWQQIC